MTVLTEDWTLRARQLAERLVEAGKLSSAQWRDAVCAVPRHELVPDVLRWDPDGSCHRLDTSTGQGQRDWLDQVYSNTALLTAVADRGESRSLRSSSSMPGLMTRMLETLEVRDGDRVLEIGYGRPDENWKPTVTSITASDGSWAEITLADHHGVHQVTEDGPRRVWRITWSLPLS